MFRDSQLARTANSVFGPPYEMRQLPGRGFGLIVNRTVQRGERIFAHTPILIAQAITETGLEKDEQSRLHKIAVERLPERSRDLFMALHGHFGGDPVYDRFSTNAFICLILLLYLLRRRYVILAGISEKDTLLTIEQCMNHNCRPK